MHLRYNNTTSHTAMAAFLVQATAVPRFFLPQSSWSSTCLRSTTLTTLEARRYRSSFASQQCARAPVTTVLQRQTTRQWRKTSPQFTTGQTAIMDPRRHFSATARQLKDHHFDTLKFVQRLKDEGFTEEQAEGMMRILSDVIEERCVYHGNDQSHSN
jgi:hypothetical protein